MKVSIVTVCLNSATSIEQTIRSVEEQDYDDLEYIIIDGGSKDGTLEIIRNRSQRISLWISEPDQGVYDAMNKGLRLATGTIVAVLNAGDVYAKPSTVNRMIETIQRKQLDAAYGDMVYINPKRGNRITRYWKTGKYRLGAFRYGWVIPHPTFFCRKTIYNQYGCFRNGIHIAADFELLLRFVEKHQIRIDYLPEVIVKMKTGGLSQNFSGIIKGNMEIMRSFSMNGLPTPPFLFLVKPFLKASQVLRIPLLIYQEDKK